MNVYALKDPRTKRIRYVGHTAFTIQRRYRQHLAARSRTPVSQWIAELAKLRLAPILTTLGAFRNEAQWIETLQPDLNVRAGRIGPPASGVTVKNYNVNASKSESDAIEQAAAIEGERFPGRWVLRAAVARANEVIKRAAAE